ncbi:MAG: ribonuclease HI [Sphingobacteriales bacterium JAD_PAG50586_3]|nr:MAG: ribonuclease HI [Sphingobacteriales bacterium JAD_PAG50586_3]
MEISIYTDGAARGNPGPGGYGIVMLSGHHRKELAAGFRYTTNNRMELLSVIVALEQLKSPGMSVTVYSDSKYVVDAVEKKWLLGWVRKSWKDVKNPDLWQRLIAVMSQHKVKFMWVKGHAENVENNRCDQLAVKASYGPDLYTDAYYESQNPPKFGIKDYKGKKA